MKVNCRAWITCDHPGCTRQFLQNHAWGKTPSEIAEIAEQEGWEKRMWMKMEPRMYCPAHSKKALAVQPN